LEEDIQFINHFQNVDLAYVLWAVIIFLFANQVPIVLQIPCTKNKKIKFVLKSWILWEVQEISENAESNSDQHFLKP